MFKVWLLTITAVVLVYIAHASAPSRPNIIFVVADDLGWNDVSWHNPGMITPNLERYARAGVILNSSYVQYFCSPSRSAFMTGYFPYHTGLQHRVIIEGQPRFVPLNFKMLPAHLKTAGYMTHIVGKWHLGMCNWKYTPTHRGFDSFYGYYNGKDDYYTHRTGVAFNLSLGPAGGYDLRWNKSVAEDPKHTHSTYLFTEHTINLIHYHDKSKPLFLYLPFQLCHYPLQVPVKYEDMYSSTTAKPRRVYSGMVSMMDEAFGNITAALDRAGLLDNSLIIFTTDNGGSVSHGGNNWPLRGGKTTFWEGGTRGVAFVWSRNLLQRTGYTNHEMIHAVDWFPTILHLAGLRPESNIDGVNQWEMLRTGAASSRTEFVYNIDTIINSTAIRYGDYKLLTGSPGGVNGWYPLPVKNNLDTSSQAVHPQRWKPQLYNIRNDPEERKDLAKKEPQMLMFMMNRLHHWMASGVKPQNSPVDPKGNPRNWGGVWTPGWC